MKLTVEGCLGLVAWINGDQHHGRRHCIDLQQWKQQLQPYTDRQSTTRRRTLAADQ